jgi:mRNA-degrading endonuclease toxin of MazEF toxin-antitoxin module
VVPLSTSEAQAKRGPSVVDLKSGSASKASYAICHQVTTLDRAKLMKKAGVVPPDVMRRVEDGIKAAMDLD